MRRDTRRFGRGLSLYGDVPLQEQSHGQSFLALATNRFGGEGSTSSTSPRPRCRSAARSRCWRSRSPPRATGARIYELDERGLSPCAYDDVDAVRLTRGFLEAPERYVRAALED